MFSFPFPQLYSNSRRISSHSPINNCRTIYLIDFSAFIVLFVCWTVLVTDLTSRNDSNDNLNTCSWTEMTALFFDVRANGLWTVVFYLNVAFGVRELRQLRATNEDLIGSIRSTIEGAGQAVLMQGSNFLETKHRMHRWEGVSRKLSEHVDDCWNAIDLLSWCFVNITLAVILQCGPWTVECATITSFLLLLRLLSYLRGFDDCGWLLIVLFAQFKGAQG